MEPAGYYNAATGLTGAALKTALHGIIDQHTALNYSPTSDALKTIDQAPGDATRVMLIYARRLDLKTAFGGAPPATWNREHLWPNSLGIDDVVPSYSDLFNLRPSDIDVNQTRANLAFDETSSTENPIIPGDDEAVLTSRDANSWEPPAEVKGDIARAMFYMDVRYEGDRASEPNLRLTDDLATITTNNANFGRLTTLLLWHLADPVSAAEQARNEAVYAVQGNRNPFIDRPGWALSVFGDPLHFSAVHAGNAMTMRWWSELTGAGLESAASPAGPWTAQSGTITRDGAFSQISVSMSAQRRFFRVRYRAPD